MQGPTGEIRREITVVSDLKIVEFGKNMEK